MKKIILVLLISCSNFALADYHKGFYGGVKSGKLNVDVSSVDFKVPLGIMAGYQWGAAGIEFEANRADLDIRTFSTSVDADYKTYGIYGVFKTDGDVYFKAKAGYVNNKISVSVAEVSESGFSTGVGVGYKINQVAIEAEYTILSKEISYLSIGLSFNL